MEYLQALSTSVKTLKKDDKVDDMMVGNKSIFDPDVVAAVPKKVSDVVIGSDKNARVGKTVEKKPENVDTKGKPVKSIIQSDKPEPKTAINSTMIEESSEEDVDDLNNAADAKKPSNIVVSKPADKVTSDNAVPKKDGKKTNSASSLTFVSSLLIVAISFLHSFV